ncbi:MAG: hypothetical protein ACLQNE_08740 [Thermoguttaceae bacterium]
MPCQVQLSGRNKHQRQFLVPAVVQHTAGTATQLYCTREECPVSFNPEPAATATLDPAPVALRRRWLRVKRDNGNRAQYTSTDGLVIKNNRLTPAEPETFVQPMTFLWDWGSSKPKAIVTELCDRPDVQAAI